MVRPLGARHFTADIARPETTPDGLERTRQVNHLSPFLLTHLLLEPRLAVGGAVINSSNVAARVGRPDVVDLGADRSWSSHRAYGDS